MKRREFVMLLGGAAAWPLAALEHKSDGVLLFSAETDTEYQTRLRAFVQTLHQLGWTEGHNVRIDVRCAGGSSQRVQEIASEFDSLAPDVVFCSGSVATAANEARNLIGPSSLRAGE